MDSALVQKIFASYNGEGSLLPFYLPFIGWTLIFIYCQIKKRSFEHWTLVHNIHHIVGLTFATLSLYYDDESIFAERIGIMWSAAYFLVDLVECIRIMSGTYTFHALCVILLSMSNLYTPRFYRLRMNSKAMFLEISSPILYLSKRTRNPVHFGLFAITFTCCRVIWMPIMMKQLLDDGLPSNDSRFLVFVAFYLLNLFWYWKIVRIVVSGPPAEKEKKQPVAEKKIE
eukprot:scaffold1736_cov127-Cylindrotheca_fusiformis.AAC.84